ncbi:hypothetical protein [Flavobacterium faecale]|uniref:hypothetical protein n=1 Tax=Flavobacterium faecale TaxID=1355330 RepID=UPI003AB091B8
MRQNILLALLVFFSINSFSQTSKLSLEANYPIPTCNNFTSKSYKGIIDFESKYRFAETHNFQFGASMNGGLLTNTTYKNYVLNVNLGIAYDISTKVFATAQYNFTKLNTKDGIPNTPFNTNVSLVKTGISLRLKLNPSI